MQLALYDLPDDYFAQFVPRIERVTTDDVSRVMARHLDPARLTTLVVGDLDAIGADLDASAWAIRSSCRLTPSDDSREFGIGIW